MSFLWLLNQCFFGWPLHPVAVRRWDLGWIGSTAIFLFTLYSLLFNWQSTWPTDPKNRLNVSDRIYTYTFLCGPP